MTSTRGIAGGAHPKHTETVLRTLNDAAWLPPGSRAEIVRSSTPQTPTCLVRLLLLRGDSIFCVAGVESGRLDIPTRLVQPADADVRLTAEKLAVETTGSDQGARQIGFVRNIVPPSATTIDYRWPVPVAAFAVWTVAAAPILQGTWVNRDEGEIAGRHWLPLVDEVLGDSV